VFDHPTAIDSEPTRTVSAPSGVRAHDSSLRAPSETGPVTQFEATLVKSPARHGCTYVVMANSAEFFGTRAAVNVCGTIDGMAFEGPLLSLGDGAHRLPIKAAVLMVLNKRAGDAVLVVIARRRTSSSPV
jgi:hypothetical protein